MTAKICTVCNIRRQYTGAKGTETAPHGSDMCNYCYEEGSWENTHSDYNHGGISQALDRELTEHEKDELLSMANCWICHPELNLAQKPKGKGTGSKTQGTRRPQFNHKGHNHPQSPAARRACKNAFWAYHRTPVNGTPAQIQAAMQAWDYRCDGNGKVVSEPKKETTAWTVVPRGPKGGVINQMKAGKPVASRVAKAMGFLVSEGTHEQAPSR